jgi:hypothetical protein
MQAALDYLHQTVALVTSGRAPKEFLRIVERLADALEAVPNLEPELFRLLYEAAQTGSDETLDEATRRLNELTARLQLGARSRGDS